MADLGPIRIILVDDHQVVLDGLQSIFAENAEVQVIREFVNPQNAIDYLETSEVDVLLTDLDMPDITGEELLVYVKSKFPRTKVVVLSMHDEKSVIKHLIEVGADGYLVKSSGKEEILKAVEVVHSGAKFFSNDVLQSLMTDDSIVENAGHPALKDLTSREIEIIKLTADGMSSKEIGEALFISPRTAETHRSNVLKKLNCTGVAGIVRFAFEAKLIS